MTAAEQWLKFANDDIRAAEVLLHEGIFNLVCFHSQQAVEKSLKAFLRFHQGKIPYVHMLEELCNRCMELDQSFSQYLDDCIELDVYYQPTRYPEAPAGSLPEGLPDETQAKNSLDKATGILTFVKKQLA